MLEGKVYIITGWMNSAAILQYCISFNRLTAPIKTNRIDRRILRVCWFASTKQINIPWSICPFRLYWRIHFSLIGNVVNSIFWPLKERILCEYLSFKVIFSPNISGDIKVIGGWNPTEQDKKKTENILKSGHYLWRKPGIQ